MAESKRSGQIPAFGNWDYANDMPITQYFESARQAGLLRFASFSGDSDLYSPLPLPPQKTKDGCDKRCSNVKEQRRLVKICEVSRPPRKHQHSLQKHLRDDDHHYIKKAVHPQKPKPVDEDLYKIPPDVLATSMREKKRRFFFSRCLMLPCMAG